MIDANFWLVERDLWVGGVETFSGLDGVRLRGGLSRPAGTLTGAAILDGLAAAPRWQEVRLDDQVLRRPAAAMVVLAYRSEAARPRPHGALCGTTFFFECQTPV